MQTNHLKRIALLSAKLGFLHSAQDTLPFPPPLCSSVISLSSCKFSPYTVGSICEFVVVSIMGFFRFSIAKTGSLCCVAARPHGSNTASRDWSVGPHEPYWRTNSSYSPPPSRWDFSFQPESLSFGSNDGIQLYGSSASSNSRDSRGWVRGNNYASGHQFLVSDGIGPYLSSLDVSPAQQWTPPAVQEISMDDYDNSSRDVVFRPLYFSPAMEGTSDARNSEGSISSRSDSSCDHEPTARTHHRNTRRSFMPKATVHPLSFFSRPDTADYRSSRCCLCGRLLSQRSPCGSRAIIRGGDAPVAAVLACRHVFHADCLDQTTHDPPCPVCRAPDESGGPHENRCRPWGCDCVPVGARSNGGSALLSSLKFRKSVSMKGGNNSEEFPGKVRRGGGGPFLPRVVRGPG
ncbi:RING/U-box superfamily protein [Striga asiatica]|uniref:RING/U-box superfamily protein n=1 Tax=Striga asiatica TaxID=4170 RepID=A0A5A7PJT7_STRAF|nr:RING/U-box superfamily protein [Striga asiatica]